MSPARPSLLELLRTLDPTETATEALRSSRHNPTLRQAVERERARLARMSRHEGLKLTPGPELVAGADEVGRGPMAGPLVAAAVAFRRIPWIPGLRDSKKLQPEEREAMVPWIHAQAETCALAVIPIEELNGPQGNIHSHSLRAVALCVEGLAPRPDRLLMDGKFTVQDLPLPQKAIVKGDDCCVSVAAASVLAKVHRDRMMVELDAAFPGYGFAQHKGYCTAEHLEALDRLGVSPVHRTHFVRVRERTTPYVQGVLSFD